MRICKGSLSLGTGCRACSRCFQELEERVKLLENQASYVQRNLIPIGARVEPDREITPSLIGVIRNHGGY